MSLMKRQVISNGKEFGATLNYAAFPSMVRMKNGKDLLGYERATGHNSNDARCVFQVSDLDGVFSTNPLISERILVDTVSKVDTNPIFLSLASGRVLALLSVIPGAGGRELDTSIYYSDDYATTWNGPILVDPTLAAVTRSLTGGSMLEIYPGGPILAAFYGKYTGGDGRYDLVFYVSFDQGLTFQYLSKVLANSSLQFEEPQMIMLPTREIYVQARVDNTVDGTPARTIRGFKSPPLSDNSFNWDGTFTTPPIVKYPGYGWPSMATRHDGSVITITRNPAGSAATLTEVDNNSQYRISWDGCETFSDPVDFTHNFYLYGIMYEVVMDGVRRLRMTHATGKSNTAAQTYLYVDTWY